MMIARAFVLTMALCAGACAMGGIVTMSKPHLAPESAVRFDDDSVVHLDRLSVSFVPQNEVGDVFGMGLVVPIPMAGSLEPTRAGQPFRFVLRFEPDVDGFTFTPSELELLFQDAVYAPVEATALDVETSTVNGEDRHVPGHRWNCWYRYLGDNLDPAHLGEAISLSKGCVAVEFPVETIHPREPFTVLLRGLRFDGEPLAPVEVLFRTYTRPVYLLMVG